MSRSSLRPLAAAFLVGAALSSAAACSSNVTLIASDLDVQPDTAQAGDTVAFVFYLAAIPSQTLTLRALVDGTEVESWEGQGVYDGLFQVDLGDAADLITRFGAGTHMGQVEVRSLEEGRLVRTAPSEFLLQ